MDNIPELATPQDVATLRTGKWGLGRSINDCLLARCREDAKVRMVVPPCPLVDLLIDDGLLAICFLKLAE